MTCEAKIAGRERRGPGVVDSWAGQLAVAATGLPLYGVQNLLSTDALAYLSGTLGRFALCGPSVSSDTACCLICVDCFRLFFNLILDVGRNIPPFHFICI